MSNTSAAAVPRNISVAEAITRRAAGVPILDVRDTDEWAAGHIPGAVHLPLDKLATGTPAPAGAVMVICRSGARATIAAKSLAAGGTEVSNIVGGMTAWAASRGPRTSDTAAPPTVA